jgi:hypothetical protein
MSSIQSALIVAVLLIWIGHSDSACPNQNFIAKHVCGNCQNETGALEFSKLRMKNDPSGENTVFFGNGGNYTPYKGPTEELCRVDVKKPTYQCTGLKTKNPRCQYIGSCKGYHATRNGHLFYNDLEGCPKKG